MKMRERLIDRARHLRTPEEIVDAVLAELREPIVFNIEHGHAPDGYPVEMTPIYADGRRGAFLAVLAMIDTDQG